MGLAAFNRLRRLARDKQEGKAAAQEPDKQTGTEGSAGTGSQAGGSANPDQANTQPPANTAERDAEWQALAEEHERVFGKKPSAKAKAETIRKKLEKEQSK